MPIPDEERGQEVPERLVEEVYAKLQNSSPNSSDDLRAASTPPPALQPLKVVPLQRRNGDTLGDLQGKREKPRKRRNQAEAKNDPQGVMKQERSKISEATPTPTPSKVVPSRAKPQTRTETLGGLFELSNATPTPTPVVRNRVSQAGARRGGSDATRLVAPRAIAPTPLPVKPTSTPSPTSIPSVSPGWYVQLAAFESKAQAGKLLSTLQENGFLEAKLQEALVRGKRYYRVLVGPERSSVLAGRLRDQLIREPYIKFKPYLKKVP
jgi:hypothetical protein